MPIYNREQQGVTTTTGPRCPSVLQQLEISVMLLTTRLSLVAFWARQAATAYDTTVCDQRSYTSSENMTCTECCPRQQEPPTRPQADLGIVNANAWNPDGRGFQCITVRDWPPRRYTPTPAVSDQPGLQVQDSPPAFEATWAWTKDPQSVHSYPHVKLAAPALPVAMANISVLHLSARWSMGPGWKPVQASKVDASGLASMGVTANVAFDMFADRNPALAGYATTAETEIMVWIGRFGAARPLGFTPDSSCARQMLGDVELQVVPLFTGCSVMPCVR